MTVTGGIGAGLTVTGAGDATVKAANIDAWEVANEKTDGTLTVESTAAGAAQDVSDVNADLIRFSGAVNDTITAQSGANLEVTADLNAGTFAVAEDTDTDSINVTFTKTQTGATTFTAGDFETVNIIAAATQAAAPTITDLTFLSLVNAGESINLSGTNDVAITSLNAKVLDASGLNGELVVTGTAGTAANVTVAGAQGKNNVTFNVAAVEAAFVGQDAADTVAFGTLAAAAKATAVTGGGNDKVTANVGTMNSADGYLVVESGAGNNTVELAGDTSGDVANIVLTFGAGTDTLKLANATNLVDANLTISGLDVIDVDGANATVAAATVTGQSYSVTGDGFATSTLTIQLADGDDVVDLSSVVATDSAVTGAKLVVVSGDGDDAITLGASAEIVEVGTVTAAGIDVITGFRAASDVIEFTGTTAVDNFVDATATDYDTGNATLADALAAVAAAEGAAAADDAIAFVYGGATYVLLTANDAYAAGDDAVVQLVGVTVADLTADNFLMA